jgi:hypothetical protein
MAGTEGCTCLGKAVQLTRRWRECRGYPARPKALSLRTDYMNEGMATPTTPHQDAFTEALWRTRNPR